jgi:large subunit ribosomal protein L24e
MKEDRFEIVLTGKFLAKFLPLFASNSFGSAADWRRLKYKYAPLFFLLRTLARAAVGVSSKGAGRTAANMRLEKCWFCSSTVYPGHGICFVRNDSKIFRFCRSKCHKNFKMKRNPRKVKWTKAYRVLHGKDAASDSVFQFERKRNRPERYDRNVTQSTLRAMKKVEEVRVRRAERFYDTRMKGKESEDRKANKRELEQQIHLVRAPGAIAKEPTQGAAKKQKVKVKVSSKATEEYD